MKEQGEGGKRRKGEDKKRKKEKTSTHPAFSAAAMDMCLLSSRMAVASNFRGRSVVMS